MRSSDALRIALFTYGVQPRGGVRHALALGEALHAAGHAVVLHALDDAGRGFGQTPRCPSVLVPLEARSETILPFVQRRIAAYVDAVSGGPAFDIYHAHDGISGNALATLVERGAIARFVRTVHHLDDFGPGELAALQDRSVRCADDVFTVSRVWAERVARTYGRAAVVVRNGVDRERFSPVGLAGRQRLRAALGHGAGPLFVTIGGIEARKNTLATLEAFARVHAVLPGARLVIAGGASIFNHSEYRRAFDARAAELGLADGTALAVQGVVSDDDVVTLLRAAHALVFPSLVEGFGLVVLEALACGTPVVTSASAPFTEYLGAGDALLVDPRDPAAIAAAMRHVLDPLVAARLRRRGPELARAFDWAASARAHVVAYRGCRSREREAVRA